LQIFFNAFFIKSLFVKVVRFLSSSKARSGSTILKLVKFHQHACCYEQLLHSGLLLPGGSEAVRVPGPTGGERVQVERVGPAVPGLQQD
jgi:hypothetical protein